MPLFDIKSEQNSEQLKQITDFLKKRENLF